MSVQCKVRFVVYAMFVRCNSEELTYFTQLLDAMTPDDHWTMPRDIQAATRVHIYPMCTEDPRALHSRLGTVQVPGRTVVMRRKERRKEFVWECAGSIIGGA